MEKYSLKYALKNLNTERIKKDLALGGGFVLTTAAMTGVCAVASYFLTGCTERNLDTASVTDAEIEETTEAIEVEEAKVETTTEVDENQAEYNKIDAMEEDIVDFAKANLPNGFGSVEITDDNKLDIAKQYVDSYIAMNLSSNESQITPNTVAVLYKNNILIPTAVKDNYSKHFVVEIGKYMRLVEPSTMIDFEVIVQEQDDAKFLNELETEIAYMNVATTEEERQTRIDNRRNMLYNIDPSTTTYNANTIYMAVNMIIRADAMARAYGNQIFADDEAKLQLYTTLEQAICNDAENNGYEINYDVEGLSSSSSFESMYFTSVSNSIEFAITSGKEGSYDAHYSYEEVTKRIAEKLLNLYKAPELDSIAKENAIREATGKSLTPTGTTTKTNVPESQVPAEYREKTTQKSDYSSNQTTEGADHVKDASESNDDYIKGYGAGRTAGADAAYNQQVSTGNIPSAISQAPTPSGKSATYIKAYKEGYVAGWNSYVQSAIDSNKEKTTETYQPVESTEEKISETVETIESTTQTTTEKTTETTTESNQYFIPVESEEEIIEEEVETITVGSAIRNRITALQALRNQVISMAYNTNTNDNNNVKRV